MNILFASLALLALIGGYFLFKRYMKQHAIKELCAFKDGHHALGRSIFHCTDKNEMHKINANLIEWEYNFEGKIEMGIFKKLTTELRKEYADKLRLLTDDR
jgi:hypothetical protein